MGRYRNLIDYDLPCRIATPEEARAYELRSVKPGRPRAPTSKPGRLCALTVGESILFPSKYRCSQLSPAIQAARRATGHRYTACVQRSLVDGSIDGVRVTRVS